MTLLARRAGCFEVEIVHCEMADDDNLRNDITIYGYSSAFRTMGDKFGI